MNQGLIPEPNSAFGCNAQLSLGSPELHCYNAVVSPPTYWREELARVDHNFSARLRGTFRYIHDSWDTTVPTPQWGYIQNSFPTVQNRFVGPGTSAVVRLTDVISPSLLNEFVFSYANSHITLTDTNGPGASFQRPAALDAPCAPDPNPPNPNNVITQCPIGNIFSNGFGGKSPGIVIAGNNQVYGGNGFAVDAGYQPWEHTNPTYVFGDSVSKVWGKHNLQFGSQFIFYQRNQTNAAIGAATGEVQGILRFTPVETGNPFANFLFQDQFRGGITSFTQDSAQLKYYQRYTIAEPYIQDDWKVSSHLTLNLGLRLSLFGTYHEKNLNAWNWVPGAFDQNLASQAAVSFFSGQLVDASHPNQPIPLDPGNLDPRITNGLVQCSVSKGVPNSCMQGHLFNPAPRIGFAWDPKGNGQTSIRGGYGIFFEHGTGNEANTGSLEGSSPNVLSLTQNFPRSWDCIGGFGTGCPQSGAYPLNVTAIPTKAVWPYVQQWSLSVQRELPGSLVAAFAYVGSKGTHLTAERQINQLKPLTAAPNSGLFLTGNPFGQNEPIVPVGVGGGDCSTYVPDVGFTLLNGTVVGKDQPAYINLEAACFGATGTQPGQFPDPNALRTFAPGFGRIYSLENIANSNYNALQATLRRTRGPLTAGVSYTYSHSIDNSSDRSDATFVNSFDLQQNRASSNYDQRHLVSVSYVYELPLARIHFGGISDWAHGDDADDSQKPPSANNDALARKILEGWEISGVTIYQSGTPFSVLNGGSTGISALDNAGVANGAGAGSYVDVVGDPHGTPPPGANNPLSFGPALLNAAAFVAPRGLTFGDAGRNFLNNPSRWNFDAALLKHYKLTEGTSLEFRAEVFNVFNHTQFRIYNPDKGNTGSNTISCYGPGPKVGGPNLQGPDYSAAGGSFLNPDGSVSQVNCLTGSAFLHPVDAHRPRTMQFGIKISF